MFTQNKIAAAKIAQMNAIRISLVILHSQIPEKYPIGVKVERIEKENDAALLGISSLLTRTLETSSEDIPIKLLEYVFGIDAFLEALSKHIKNTRQTQLITYLTILMASMIPGGATTSEIKQALGVKRLSDSVEFLEEINLIRREETGTTRVKRIVATKKLICNLTT